LDKKDARRHKGSASGSYLSSIRRYLLTGIAVLLPSVVTIWLLWSLFAFVDGLPKKIPGHPFENIPGVGVIIFFALILFVGMFASNVIGKRMISFGERIMARIPLASKIYASVQQIIDAVMVGKGTVFSTVVLVEYPRKGIYSLGFVTSEMEGEVQYKTAQQVISVFIPTTPNPTSGLLVFVPKEDVIHLTMSTEDGLKLVISGGFVSPAYAPPAPVPSQPNLTADLKTLGQPEKLG
jgi:uncharacterized membrane protein